MDNPSKGRWLRRALWVISVAGLTYAAVLIVGVLGDNGRELPTGQRHRPGQEAVAASQIPTATSATAEPNRSPAGHPSATRTSRPPAPETPAATRPRTGSSSPKTGTTPAATQSAQQAPTETEPTPTPAESSPALGGILDLELGITV